MKTITLNGAELNLTPEQEKDLLAQLTKKQGRWKPEDKTIYWAINSLGYACQRRYYKNHKNFNISIGNFFPSVEDCKQALKTGWVARLQAEQRIKDYILEKGYDTDVDWNDKRQIKANIGSNYETEELEIVHSWHSKKSILPYFKHDHEAEDTLNHCKKDYKLLLGVE